MKIGDIKKGTEYGLAQRHGDPRRVLALGVVTVPVNVWDNNLERHVSKNVRQVSIKFLDNPRDSYHARKGSKTTVEARSLIAAWAKLGPSIQKRADDDARRDAMRVVLERRVKSLLGRNYDGYTSVSDITRPSLDVRGRSLDKLLELAEKGAGQ